MAWSCRQLLKIFKKTNENTLTTLYSKRRSLRTDGFPCIIAGVMVYLIPWAAYWFGPFPYGMAASSTKGLLPTS